MSLTKRNILQIFYCILEQNIILKDKKNIEAESNLTAVRMGTLKMRNSKLSLDTSLMSFPVKCILCRGRFRNNQFSLFREIGF